MENFINTLKAVSDTTRTRIIMALSNNDELCVCRITEMLNLAPSTVSKHMSILKHNGLVNSRKKGKWIYFSLNNNPANTLCESLIALLKDNLGNDSVIKKDKQKLNKILSCAGEEKC